MYKACLTADVGKSGKIALDRGHCHNTGHMGLYIYLDAASMGLIGLVPARLGWALTSSML